MRKIGYINLTPRWSELLTTWQMIVNDAVRVKKPGQMKNFWSQVDQSFKIADNYNDLIASLRDYGWTDEAIEKAILRGRELTEKERNTIHYEEAAA